MKLTSTLKSLWNRLGSFQSKALSPRAWLAGRDESLSGPGVLTNAFQQSTWVHACVTTLAESVSAIPFRFVRDDSSPSTPSPINHQLTGLFERPNPHLDKFQFWELLVTWLSLRGEAFIYPLRLSLHSRQPYDELHILNPDDLKEIIQDGQLVGWRHRCGLSTTDLRPPVGSVLLPEELIHIRLPNPFNPIRGLSPLQLAWLPAQTDYASAQFMKGTMLNNADIGMVVSCDGQTSPEQRAQITASLLNRKRGAGAADRPLFLGGGIRVETPRISAVDLQFLENRKANRQEICAIFKVPQELLGFTEDANRSVSDAARLNFMENRIIPLCRRLEAAVLPIIRAFDPKLRGEFYVQGAPIMQSAQYERIDYAEKLFALGVPLNVINQNLRLGLPDLPHGNTPFVSTRVRPVSEPPSTDTQSSSVSKKEAPVRADKPEHEKGEELPACQNGCALVAPPHGVRGRDADLAKRCLQLLSVLSHLVKPKPRL